MSNEQSDVSNAEERLDEAFAALTRVDEQMSLCRWNEPLQALVPELHSIPDDQELPTWRPGGESPLGQRVDVLPGLDIPYIGTPAPSVQQLGQLRRNKLRSLGIYGCERGVIAWYGIGEQLGAVHGP